MWVMLIFSLPEQAADGVQVRRMGTYGIQTDESSSGTEILEISGKNYQFPLFQERL